MDVLYSLVAKFLPLGNPQLSDQECCWLLAGVRNYEPLRLFLLLFVSYVANVTRSTHALFSYSVGGSVDPYLGTGTVLANDLLFALHAFAMSTVQMVQIFMYEVSSQPTLHDS